MNSRQEENNNKSVQAAESDVLVEEEQPPGNSISGLPDELILHIFSFFSKNDLAKASQVCKRWNSLAQDQSLEKARFAAIDYTKYSPNKSKQILLSELLYDNYIQRPKDPSEIPSIHNVLFLTPTKLFFTVRYVHQKNKATAYCLIDVAKKAVLQFTNVDALIIDALVLSGNRILLQCAGNYLYTKNPRTASKIAEIIIFNYLTFDISVNKLSNVINPYYPAMKWKGDRIIFHHHQSGLSIYQLCHFKPGQSAIRDALVNPKHLLEGVPVRAFAFIDSDKLILTSPDTEEFWLWSFGAKGVIHSLDWEQLKDEFRPYYVNNFQFYRLKNNLIAFTSAHVLRIFEIENDQIKLKHTLKNVSFTHPFIDINKLLELPNNYIMGNLNDNTLIIWDTISGKRIQKIKLTHNDIEIANFNVTTLANGNILSYNEKDIDSLTIHHFARLIKNDNTNNNAVKKDSSCRIS